MPYGDVRKPMDDDDIDELINTCRNRQYVHKCEQGYDDEANRKVIHLQASRCPIQMTNRINFYQIKLEYLGVKQIDGKPCFDLYGYVRKTLRRMRHTTDEPLDDEDIDKLVDHCRRQDHVNSCERGFDEGEDRHYIQFHAVQCPSTVINEIHKLWLKYIEAKEIDNEPVFGFSALVRRGLGDSGW